MHKITLYVMFTHTEHNYALKRAATYMHMILSDAN